MARILVVDDLDTNRVLLRTVLKSVGHDVVECASGAECLKLCAAGGFDLVILDILMPELDGIEVCRRLRERHSRLDLPVVIVTSKGESDALPEALEAGANDFISKPIHRQVLLARINNILECSSAQKELASASVAQRVICDAIPDPLVLVDRTGLIRLCNQALVASCYGAKPKNIEQVFASMYGGEFFESSLRLVSSVQSHPDGEFVEEFKGDQRSPRIVQVVTRPIPASSIDEGRIWIFRDITASREMAKRAEDKVRLESVGVLVSGIAHNYNNILGGILGAVNVLERASDGNDRLKRAVKVVRVGAETAAKLNRKLDIFTRPDLGQESINNESVEDVLETIHLMMQERVGDRITFSLSSEQKVPPVAMTLAAMLEVFNNIFSNAIDAIEGIGKVETFVNYDDAKQRVVVKVADTGCGINAQVKERVFEPFFTTKNLDHEHSVALDGKGLGLWNVYNLLRLSGGDIEIDSVPGSGTAVTLFLPSAKDELIQN